MNYPQITFNPSVYKFSSGYQCITLNLSTPKGSVDFSTEYMLNDSIFQANPVYFLSALEVSPNTHHTNNNSLTPFMNIRVLKEVYIRGA